MAGLAVDQPLERGVGLDHRGVNAHIAALDQAVLLQGAKDQNKNLVINLHAQAGADDRQGGMVRGVAGQVIAQEGPDGNGILAALGNAPLAGNILEETNHEHLEIHHRVNARTTASVVVVSSLAEPPDFRGERKRLERLVKLDVKGSARR